MKPPAESTPCDANFTPVPRPADKKSDGKKKSTQKADKGVDGEGEDKSRPRGIAEIKRAPKPKDKTAKRIVNDTGFDDPDESSSGDDEEEKIKAKRPPLDITPGTETSLEKSPSPRYAKERHHSSQAHMTSPTPTARKPNRKRSSQSQSSDDVPLAQKSAAKRRKIGE